MNASATAVLCQGGTSTTAAPGATKLVADVGPTTSRVRTRARSGTTSAIRLPSVCSYGTSTAAIACTARAAGTDSSGCIVDGSVRRVREALLLSCQTSVATVLQQFASCCRPAARAARTGTLMVCWLCAPDPVWKPPSTLLGAKFASWILWYRWWPRVLCKSSANLSIGRDKPRRTFMQISSAICSPRTVAFDGNPCSLSSRKAVLNAPHRVTRELAPVPKVTSIPCFPRPQCGIVCDDDKIEEKGGFCEVYGV